MNEEYYVIEDMGKYRPFRLDQQVRMFTLFLTSLEKPEGYENYEA